MSYNQLLNELKDAFNFIHKSFEEQLPTIKEEVNYLVRSKSKDAKRMEHLCDNLLEMINFGIGKQRIYSALRILENRSCQGCCFLLE